MAPPWPSGCGCAWHIPARTGVCKDQRVCCMIDLLAWLPGWRTPNPQTSIRLALRPSFLDPWCSAELGPTRRRAERVGPVCKCPQVSVSGGFVHMLSMGHYLRLLCETCTSIRCRRSGGVLKGNLTALFGLYKPSA